MSRLKLHPTPRWSTVLAKQSAALLAGGRFLALLPFVVLPLLLGSTLPTLGNPNIPMAGIAYFSVGFAALFWPFHLWRGEGWGKRDYRWSLPEDPIVLDLTRVLIGWFWLIAVVATLLIGSSLLDLSGVIWTDADLLSRPRYLVAMVTLPTIVYLIASSVALITQMPFTWFIVPYLLASWGRGILESIWPLRLLVPWYDAMSQTVVVMVSDPISRTNSPAESWALASVFGGGIAVLCVLAAIWRYQRPIR